jgi:mono/diheme cytochrome c family protein
VVVVVVVLVEVDVLEVDVLEVDAVVEVVGSTVVAGVDESVAIDATDGEVRSVAVVSEPQAARPTARAPAATMLASDVIRSTNATVDDPADATLADMGGSGVRYTLGVAGTVMLAAAGAACGADGPRTALERGEAIYAANCALCHGGDLAGSDRGPSLLDPVYGPDQLSDTQFADAVRNGVDERLWDFGAMPGNGSYTDDQIAALIAFVRAEQAGEPTD